MFTDIPKLVNLISVEDRLILVCQNEGRNFLDNTIHILDITNGNRIKVELGDKHLTRTVSTIASVGKNIVILGNQFKSSSSYSSQFVSVFNLGGIPITNHVLHSGEKTGLQFSPLGHFHDENGDLLLFCESFRKIKVKPSERQILTRTFFWNGSTLSGSGGRQDVIENLKAIKVSSQDFSVDESMTFQTDRRKGFTIMKTFNDQILLRLNDKVWFYDPTAPASPPKFLLNIPDNKGFELTSFGPISVEEKDGTIVFELLLGN